MGKQMAMVFSRKSPETKGSTLALSREAFSEVGLGGPRRGHEDVSWKSGRTQAHEISVVIFIIVGMVSWAGLGATRTSP